MSLSASASAAASLDPSEMSAGGGAAGSAGISEASPSTPAGSWLARSVSSVGSTETS